jgi:2-isopropylmalate synthase
VASGYLLRQAYAGRTHPADIHAIAEIAQAAGVGVDAYVFIGASPIRQYVEDWDIALIQSRIRTSVTECRREGVELVLVLEDAVRCTPDILGKIYRIAIDAGVRRVTLCDTAGVALPTGTTALINWSSLYFSYHEHQVSFEWHGHNDRGLALINSLTAFGLGCSRVHGTILGVGERAGNASLDQLMVNSHLDQHGEYDLAALRRYCEYAESVLGMSIPRNYPAMGRDVVKTSASVPASLLGRAQEVLIDEQAGP